jgi:hypothetical protein
MGRIKKGDEVRVVAGRFEGRTGVVTRILREGAEESGALALVTFPGGATDYLLVSNLEIIGGTDSPEGQGDGGSEQTG